MKLKSILILALAVLFFAGCGAGFLLDTGDVKGKSFTYTMSGNGYDYATFTFDSTGTAGTFEMGMYTYGFATQVAQDSGKYTDKTWYMNDGQRGSFTFNEATYIATVTATEMYALDPDATTSFSADYTWLTLLDFMKDQMSPDVTAGSMTMEMTFVPNSDFVETEAAPYVKDGTNWKTVMNQTMSVTANDVTTVMIDNYSSTLTISGTQIVKQNAYFDSTKVGTADADTTTETITYTDTVTNFYIIGEETTDSMTFDKIWKEGNAVSFWTSEARYEDLEYDGPTAPSTAPDIDETTGIGSANNADPYWDWYIDVSGADDTDAVTFTHYGDFILPSYDYIAGRGM